METFFVLGGALSTEESKVHDELAHPVDDCWLVSISVDDREDQTVAKACLQFRGSEWVGAGISRLAPSEQGIGGTGSQMAVTRALSDLARSLGAPTPAG